MRRAPAAWRIAAATLVALVTSIQLLLTADVHDELHDANPGHDHACVVCAFSHAQEAGPAVLGDLVAPQVGRAALPAAELTPHTARVVVAHPARGPPAPRA